MLLCPLDSHFWTGALVPCLRLRVPLPLITFYFVLLQFPILPSIKGFYLHCLLCVPSFCALRRALSTHTVLSLNPCPLDLCPVRASTLWRPENSDVPEETATEVSEKEK